MIRAMTDKKQRNRILVEIDATEYELISEFSVLLSEMRRKHKDIYFSALKYARLTNQEEIEEDD